MLLNIFQQVLPKMYCGIYKATHTTMIIYLFKITLLLNYTAKLRYNSAPENLKCKFFVLNQRRPFEANSLRLCKH